MRTAPIGTLVTLLKRGVAPKYAEKGHVVLNQKCIRGYLIDYSLSRRIRADAKVAEEKWVQRWDVLVNSTGVGTLGRVAQVTKAPADRATVDTHVTIVRPDPDKVDPLFFGFAVKAAQPQIEGMGAGATGQTELSRERLGTEIVIALPDRAEQKRIAAILSAYDALIENNTRRIAILEEMARRLYEEWFVHFRFPGHELAEFEDTELGRTPSEWPIVAFTELADVLSGGTPKKTESDFWDGEIPFYTPKDAPSSVYCLETLNRITEAGLKKCSSRLYPKNTVFITARGTVGRVALPARPMAMNQSCYALRGRNGYGQLFLYLATRDLARQLKARSHGAVFDTIIVDTFRQLLVPLPPSTLATAFEARVRPMFDQLHLLERKNANLRAQRDLLLPKLVSGEIDVSEAEAGLEAAE